MLFNNAKEIIKDNICIKFYDQTRALYLESDSSGIGLGAGLLQIRDVIVTVTLVISCMHKLENPT